MASALSFQVFMASHLGSAKRHQTIAWALDSLRKQTRLPDAIRIAYSFDMSSGGDPPDIETWKQIVAPIPLILDCYRSGRQSQFQHYYRLFAAVCHSHDADRIICMFLDDDDYYHADKVAAVAEAFEKHDATPAIQVVQHESISFGGWYDGGKILTPPHHILDCCCKYGSSLARWEYWSYAVRASCIRAIDDELEGQRLGTKQHETLFDTYFANAIQCLYGNTANLHVIRKMLHYYRSGDWIQKDYPVDNPFAAIHKGGGNGAEAKR